MLNQNVNFYYPKLQTLSQANLYMSKPWSLSSTPEPLNSPDYELSLALLTLEPHMQLRHPSNLKTQPKISSQELSLMRMFIVP